MKQTSHEVASEIQDKAILVSLVLKSSRQSEEMIRYSLEELTRLAETAGVEVLESVVQVRDAVDPAWFIGKGKAEELREAGQRLGANTAIFDQELTGAQVRNLEHALDMKIIDRTQLILDIFAQRAKTREGIIQVELAQLSYLLPRLSGHGVNLSRLGGGIGTRGPGETKLETDRRHIRRRISDLREALKEVKKHRELLRERRKKTGVFQTALVGYTNAGKSTLLNRLTESDVLAENRLFATLDPTSRMLKLPNGQEIVLTDTVGFIQNLPHDLVAAFRATLEEVCEADLILHVVDSASPMRTRQMNVVDEVLEELGASGKPRITVFNKIDLLPDGGAGIIEGGKDVLKVSAFSNESLKTLMHAIEDKLMGGEKKFRIPASRGDLISLVYRVGDVLEQTVDGDEIRFSVKVKNSDFEKFGYRLNAFHETATGELEGESDLR
jgi:GTP-binding protein HflX